MSLDDLEGPVDLDFLTPEERDVILNVLARDENLKRKEEERIELLKREIRELRAEEFSRISFDASRLCSRCLQEFSWLFNRGQVCSKCRLRVCKKCRQFLTNRTWMCLVCLRIGELESQTGSWFYTDYPQNKKNMSSCQVISALDLLRSSLAQSDQNDDVIGRYHVTSMMHLPSVFNEEEEEEDLEKLSDSDSLFSKFLSSSTPNLSIKSADRGSLTNLYIADAKELQEELPTQSAEVSPRLESNVFDDSDKSATSENLDSSTMREKSYFPIDSGSFMDVEVMEEDENLKTSGDRKTIDEKLFPDESSCREVKIIVAEEDDSQNDVTNNDSNEKESTTDDESSGAAASPTSGASSDAVRLKVGALLAKYGRQDVTTSYSTIYESILNTTPDDRNNDKRDSDPVLQASPKEEILDSNGHHALGRKYPSADSSPTSDKHDTSQDDSTKSLMEDVSPVVESLGGNDDEDDPLRRFLMNEALLHEQHGDDIGFSSAVSWVTGGSYDLDWDASDDEEAPFAIHDFDHVSTGFLEEEESKGAFSDLRSVINNILRQSPHEVPHESEDEDEERGDTIILPVSSSIPVFPRNAIPMLRKKSLSVISEHTEPSACSSFDEASFVGEFTEREETQNPSLP